MGSNNKTGEYIAMLVEKLKEQDRRYHLLEKENHKLKYEIEQLREEQHERARR